MIESTVNVITINTQKIPQKSKYLNTQNFRKLRKVRQKLYNTGKNQAKLDTQ